MTLASDLAVSVNLAWVLSAFCLQYYESHLSVDNALHAETLVIKHKILIWKAVRNNSGS